MEFLVTFEMNIPPGTAESEIHAREQAEAASAAALAREGRLLRLWRLPVADGSSQILGLYRSDSEASLKRLLVALPLYDWMHVRVVTLAAHPNDPGVASAAAIDRQVRQTSS